MPKTAFVFPGQGSQSIGMLNAFKERFPFIMTLFSSVSERLGFDLWSLIQTGPETKLNQTEYTQVAMLTADVAVFQILQHLDIPMPLMMSGHSLGEYAALVCAKAISLEDAASLVCTRGQLMQKAMPMGYGSMAAIVGLEDSVVLKLCESIHSEGSEVSPANYNAIGQVVIAGHTEAVLKAIQEAETLGARLAKVIPVSVPCHCSLLKDMAEEFANVLNQTPFQVPSLDVISPVDLNIYHSVHEIRSVLKEQLCAPVRWVETIQQMKQRGIEQIIECGPGKVLSGLIKRIDKSIDVLSLGDEASLDAFLEKRGNEWKK